MVHILPHGERGASSQASLAAKSGHLEGAALHVAATDGEGTAQVGALPTGQDGEEGAEMGKQVQEGGALAASVETVGFCKTHPWAATGGVDGNLCVWDLSGSAHCRHVCRHARKGVTKLQWHESQPVVYSTCVDAVLREWDARTGAVLRVFTGHKDMILDLTVLHVGGETRVVTACDDNKVAIFKL